MARKDVALGLRDCAADRLRVVVPGVVLADGGAGGGTEGGAKGGVGDEALEGGAEGFGLMRVEKEAVDAVGEQHAQHEQQGQHQCMLPAAELCGGQRKESGLRQGVEGQGEQRAHKRHRQRQCRRQRISAGAAAITIIITIATTTSSPILALLRLVLFICLLLHTRG